MNLVRSIKSHLTIDQLISMVRRFYKNDIVRKSLITMVLQGTGRCLRFVFWILIARQFSTTVVGEMVFGFSMATVLSALFVLGGDVIAAREWGFSSLSKHQKLKMLHELINKLFYRGIKFIALFYIFYTIVLLHSSHAHFMRLNLMMLLLILPYFIIVLAKSYYIALEKAFMANAMEVVQALCLLIPLVFFKLNKFSNVQFLMSMILCSLAVVALTMLSISVIRYGLRPRKLIGHQSSLVLLKIGNVLYSFVDLTVLKLFSTSVNVAHYGIAMQLSVIVSFGLAAIGQNTMSKVARSYSYDSRKEFQKKLLQYTKVTCVFSITPFVLLIFFGPFIFSMYGESYLSSYPILLVLLVGNLSNGMFGNSAIILNMTKNEKVVSQAFWKCMALNVTFATILVHYYSAIGVALSSAMSMIIWNMILYSKVKSLIDVDPSVFTLYGRERLISNDE
jgi:O-antigen/teichoic acid export membrane protein